MIYIISIIFSFFYTVFLTKNTKHIILEVPNLWYGNEHMVVRENLQYSTEVFFLENFFFAYSVFFTAPVANFFPFL